MKSRKKYYMVMWVYIERRNKLRKRVGVGNPGYKEAVKNFNIKIASCRQAMKRIDVRSKKLGELVKEVNEYFQIKIESERMDYRHKLGRNVYYKYAMEVLGIEGNEVSQHIGRPKTAAHRSRLGFTRRFKTQLKNKDDYHEFKNYLTL